MAEIGEFADVVDLHVSGLLAESRSCPLRSLVISSLRGCGARSAARSAMIALLLPCEWDAAEPCDQWCPACAFDAWPGSKCAARAV